MRARQQDQLAALLNEGLLPHEVRLEARQVKLLASQWPAWVKRQTAGDTAVPLRAAHFLMSRIEALAGTIAALREGQSNFSRRHAIAMSPGERRRIILDYAAELGANARALRGDSRAFRRWFGPDAVQDRARVQISQTERMLGFILQALGRIAARHLAGASDQQAEWRALALEPYVQPLLGWDGDARVRTDAFHCLSSALKAMSPELASHAITDTTVAYIWRAALDQRLDVWIQREALLLVSFIAFEQLPDVLRQRLAGPGLGDDLFVRRYVVELVGSCMARNPALEALLSTAAADPSPFVRQAAAHSIVFASDKAIRAHWPVLGLEDGVVQVRAAALLQLPLLTRKDSLFTVAHEWLIAAIERETTPFGLRVMLKVAEDAAAACGERQQEWLAAVLPSIEGLHVGCTHLQVRRWAAETPVSHWSCWIRRRPPPPAKLLPTARKTVARLRVA